MRNNKGFTLLEMIISLVLSSIVILSIGIYTIVGIRNFRDARAETMSQQEAEVVTMILKDKMKSLKTYQIYEDENIYALEILYGDGTDTTYSIYDTAFIYSPSRTDLYIYNAGESNTMGIDFTTLDLDTLRRTGLVSTYVTGFEVTPDSKDETVNGVVSTYIQVSFADRTYAQSFNTRIRNIQEGEEEP